MNELHIPFGIDRETGGYIEPEDALRGRKCNCLCPGCNMPLLSRHPVDKRIHFAHDSMHPDAQPQVECPLSPMVSLVMMAHRVAPFLIEQNIFLNEYATSIFYECCNELPEPLIFTKARAACIDDAESETLLGGVKYDLRILVNGADHFIDIIHQHKPPKDLPSPIFLKNIGGIIQIDGEDFYGMVNSEQSLKKRYSLLVREFLLAYSFKRWIYYKGQESIIDKVRSKHVCKKTPNPTSDKAISTNLKHRSKYQIPHNSKLYQNTEQSRHIYEVTPQQQVKPEIYTFECLYCRVRYQAFSNMLPRCSKCNEYLGARRIE